MKKIHRKFATILAISASAIFAACVLHADETTPATMPTTAPTTRPAGVSLRGKVSISHGFALQNPDLTRVVVYLASDPVLDAAPHTIDHSTVAQKNKAFVPNFTVVPRGTDVEFPNWDNFDHNVFSCSKAAPAFDLDRYPRGQSKTRTFDKVGVVQIFCNIHPSMRAIIFVTPNVYFCRADAGGNFELKDVPPGNYDLVAWQERCGETRQAVAVRADGAPDVSIALAENRQDIVANDLGPHDSGYGINRGLGIKREHLNLPVVTDAHPALDPEK
jgi:plastocyanin